MKTIRWIIFAIVSIVAGHLLTYLLILFGNWLLGLLFAKENYLLVSIVAKFIGGYFLVFIASTLIPAKEAKPMEIFLTIVSLIYLSIFVFVLYLESLGIAHGVFIEIALDTIFILGIWVGYKKIILNKCKYFYWDRPRIISILRWIIAILLIPALFYFIFLLYNYPFDFLLPITTKWKMIWHILFWIFIAWFFIAFLDKIGIVLYNFYTYLAPNRQSYNIILFVFIFVFIIIVLIGVWGNISFINISWTYLNYSVFNKILFTILLIFLLSFPHDVSKGDDFN